MKAKNQTSINISKAVKAQLEAITGKSDSLTWDQAITNLVERLQGVNAKDSDRFEKISKALENLKAHNESKVGEDGKYGKGSKAPSTNYFMSAEKNGIANFSRQLIKDFMETANFKAYFNEYNSKISDAHNKLNCTPDSAK